MRHLVSVVLLLVAGVGLSAAPALARPRRAVHARHGYTAPPLTIHGRSFLDPGVVAPIGSENSYVWAVTQPRQDMMEQGFGRSLFGNDLLPGQFLPGRPEAVVEF